MTTYTRADLATRVLKDLGLVGAEETPDAADQEWAVETVSAEISLLDAIDMPIWNGSDMAVPQEYLTILSRRIGLALEPSFGLSSIANATMAMKEVEKTLRRMASKPATGSVAEADYF
jgi:hypothetical protein